MIIWRGTDTEEFEFIVTGIDGAVMDPWRYAHRVTCRDPHPVLAYNYNTGPLDHVI
jgi:hypothetical protein